MGFILWGYIFLECNIRYVYFFIHQIALQTKQNIKPKHIELII